MDEPNTYLNDITTRWPLIQDPVQFVMRYAPAIRRYVAAIVRKPDEIDDVLQDFLTRVVERGFAPQQVTRGRFRDYLKSSVRNAALTHLRKRSAPQASDLQLDGLAAADDDVADREWLDEWRITMLDQAFEKLEDLERHSPESRLYTVLALTREYPDAESGDLARRAAERTGRPMTAEAFRKQLSRARVRLAELLVDEVRRTLEDADEDRIDAELADLRLLDLVQPYR